MPNIIEHLEFQAKHRPDSPVIFYGDHVLTFFALNKLVKQLAQKLRASGIGASSLVSLQINHPTFHIALMLAIFHEAAISCSVADHQFIPAEIKVDFYVLDTDHANPTNLSESQGKIILINDEWLTAAYIDSGQSTFVDYPDKESICRLILSSGTTGDAKAIALSHGDLETRVAFRNSTDPQRGPEMSLFDCCSSIGFYTVFKSILSGLPLILAWSYELVISDIARFGITNLLASPIQLSQIAHYIKGPTTNSLRSITTAGSVINNHLIEILSKNLCPNINIRYGSAETSSIATSTARELLQFPGTVGFPLPQVQVQIVDENHHRLPTGEVGVIRVKTPYMAHEYYQNPIATAEYFVDGWFYPGDLGSLDQNGRLFLNGRNNNVINIGGVKINPIAIDQLLLKEVGVRDTASVGIANILGIEEIWTAVVLDPQTNIEDLRQKLNLQLAASYRPNQLIVLQSIPRNPNGKVMKSQLKAALEAALI